METTEMEHQNDKKELRLCNLHHIAVPFASFSTANNIYLHAVFMLIAVYLDSFSWILTEKGL